jgi:hypothetical protein
VDPHSSKCDYDMAAAAKRSCCYMGGVTEYMHVCKNDSVKLQPVVYNHIHNVLINSKQ